MSAATGSAAADRPVVTDERILAAGTTLRFVLLLFLFVAETYSITGDVATHLADGSRNDAVGCLLAAGGNPDLGSMLGTVPAMGDYAAYEACLHRYVPDTSWAQFVVTGTMIIAAAVLYRLLPVWKARRSRYVPLARFDAAGDLTTVIAGLVRHSKLPVTLNLDDCYVDLGAASASAVVFGTRRHPRIRLNLGLLRIREKNPDRFNAVMLHELAHIANRDVGITYATVAVWRVFLIAALLPGAVDDVISLLTEHTPAAWGETTADKSGLLLEVLIVVLAYLTRADILRTREIYADRTAQSNNAMLDREGPAEAVRLSAWRRASANFAQLWRTHPSWTARHAALRDPSILFRPRFSVLFITAFAADIAAHALIPESDNWGSLPQAFIAALVVGIGGIAVWRAVVAATVSRSAPPSGWLIGLWPGLGLAAAELLRNADDGGRWVPEHPEAVLVLVAATSAITAWTAQYAELWIKAFPRANLRLAMVIGLVAPGLTLAVILVWWDSAFLLHGWLFDNGQVLTALQLPSHPPWQVAPLPFITAMPGLEMTFKYFVWGLPLLWLIPLAQWSRRVPAAPAPRLAQEAPPSTELADAERPQLARPLSIGTIGCVLIVGALMATHWYLRPVRTYGGYVVLAAETVWIILVLLTAMAVTSAFATGMARGRYPLIQGLLAAGITGVLGLVVVWLQNAADGCLGPFNTGNERQCRFEPAFPRPDVRADPRIHSRLRPVGRAIGGRNGSGSDVALAHPHDNINGTKASCCAPNQAACSYRDRRFRRNGIPDCRHHLRVGATSQFGVCPLGGRAVGCPVNSVAPDSNPSSDCLVQVRGERSDQLVHQRIPSLRRCCPGLSCRHRCQHSGRLGQDRTSGLRRGI
ncbi:M48 family metalloprotease [Catenulispora pinisilvae]|uniref:M48 family metalloprotease n=1 Tax=Catenulispora pinisilvae TaxID=2705253 RepID=UPI0018925301|nr:M48 family metalloprotease [Catenulispora pinisilvae]